MADDRHSALISELVRNLQPVRRLRPPAANAASWLAVAIGIAVILSFLLRGTAADPVRVGTATWMALTAAVATAALGALSVFELSFPDRVDAWVVLPGLPFAAWLTLTAMSGLDGTAASWGAGWAEARQCLLVIVGSGALLSIVLIGMLRRMPTQRAFSVAFSAGIASAAASFAILIIVHPHDPAALDLKVHLASSLAVLLTQAFSVGGLRVAQWLRETS